ncbi:MAG: hypothetical protein U1B30_07790 [Pseudomonadota bacterium]|nr:hypothetical protein [Pseudomonadota bacterium]
MANQYQHARNLDKPNDDFDETATTFASQVNLFLEHAEQQSDVHKRDE